jgi:hypothetical protein
MEIRLKFSNHESITLFIPYTLRRKCNGETNQNGLIILLTGSNSQEIAGC